MSAAPVTPEKKTTASPSHRHMPQDCGLRNHIDSSIEIKTIAHLERWSACQSIILHFCGPHVFPFPPAGRQQPGSTGSGARPEAAGGSSSAGASDAFAAAAATAAPGATTRRATASLRATATRAPTRMATPGKVIPKATGAATGEAGLHAPEERERGEEEPATAKRLS